MTTKWDGGTAWKDWRPALRALLIEHGAPASMGDLAEALGMRRATNNGALRRNLLLMVEAREVKTWVGEKTRWYQWVGLEKHGPLRRDGTL